MLNLILSSSAEYSEMTLYEIFSVASLIITSIIALASIIAPCIILFLNNRAQNKQKKIDLYFDLYKATIDEFTHAYGNWRSHISHKKDLLSAIYKLSYLCSNKRKNNQIFERLGDIVLSENPNGRYADEIFYKCLALAKEELSL